MTSDIRDLAAGIRVGYAEGLIRALAKTLPMNAASLEVLLGVCDRFATELHAHGGVKGADEVVGLISDALIAADKTAAITPEDRTEWAADDRANARVDERRLERME